MKLVVARWNESVEWAKRFDHFIVQKGEHLPNVGREATSYLWYLAERYDDLGADCLGFSQGSPHCKPDDYDVDVATFQWLQPAKLACNHNGAPTHGGLPVAETAERIGLRIEWPIKFSPCSMFVVGRDVILARPRDFYRNALDVATKCPSSPWVFERLWEQVFTAELINASPSNL